MIPVYLVMPIFIIIFAVLSASAQDATAFHCKMVCLIQLSRFDEALTAMHKHAQMAR